ncbi:MAG TPA: HdeD family acid-resistance protein [Polyangia bacterium]|jgi:uncharacterized membrane protein HdeD (DUF308 family)
MEPSTIQANPLVRNWWLVLLRGIVGLIFGIVTIVAPGIALATMVLVLGAYAFADGVLAIVSILLRRRSGPPWPALLLEGLMGIVVGLIAVFRPSITAFGLLVLISAWALVTGALEIVAAVRWRKLIAGAWLLGFGGFASVALGVLLVLFPAAGMLTIIWWTGGYAILFGVVMIALGLRLHSWSRTGGRRSVGGVGVPPSAVHSVGG